MQNISKQLIHLRKQLGLTQAELANKIGIHQTMISDYEAGKCYPTQETIKKFNKQGITIGLESNQVAQIKQDKEGKAMDIAKEIIKIRTNLGLNQSQFAREIGVDPSVVSKIESGKRPSTQKMLRKIADKVGITLEEEKIANNTGYVRFTFNIENKVFELRYSSHKETLASRTYQLETDSEEYHQFIEFLAIKFPTQAKNLKVKNVKEVRLLVSCNKTTYFYTLELKGDTTGIVAFKPSKFEDIFEEEKVVEEKEMNQITAKKHISTLDIYLKNASVAVNYNEHHYSDRKKTSTYRLCLNKNFTEFFKFLKRNNLYNQDKKITDAYLDIYFKTPLSILTLFGENLFEKIRLPLTMLVDLDETHDIPEFLKPSENEEAIVEDKPMIPIPVLLQNNKKEQLHPERDILILCKNIIQIRDLLDQTLELAQKVVQPMVDKEKEVIEVKKERKILEVIHKVYKQEIDGGKCVYVGTKTLTDGIIFRVAPPLKNSQDSWKVYCSSSFNCQKETHYDDGTVELGELIRLVPSTKIQEIESSDRKGVIGYVEHKAGIVEVIYYDRFVN